MELMRHALAVIVAVIIAVGVGSPAAWAATDTAAGLWHTIDDATGKVRSLIRITEHDGSYSGKVEQILITLPDDDPQHRCVHCTGERKDQPIVGMTVLWDMHRDGDSYTGGELLDPHNGKTYSAKMTLLDGGRKLDVRGFIGFSLIGRSQIWVRDE
jgi:uncharacterized protein (DUF2147 family)